MPAHFFFSSTSFSDVLSRLQKVNINLHLHPEDDLKCQKHVLKKNKNLKANALQDLFILKYLSFFLTETTNIYIYIEREREREGGRERGGEREREKRRKTKKFKCD